MCVCLYYYIFQCLCVCVRVFVFIVCFSAPYIVVRCRPCIARRLSFLFFRFTYTRSLYTHYPEFVIRDNNIFETWFANVRPRRSAGILLSYKKKKKIQLYKRKKKYIHQMNHLNITIYTIMCLCAYLLFIFIVITIIYFIMRFKSLPLTL